MSSSHRPRVRAVLAAAFLLAAAAPAAGAQLLLTSDTEQHWYALIDTLGNQVGTRKFEYFRDFKHGRAAAGVSSLQKSWLTLEGEALPGHYKSVSDFDAQGLAMATDYQDHAVVVDRDGKVVRTIKPKVFRVMRESLFGYTGKAYNKVGLVDAQGREVLKPTYTYISEFHEGLAPVLVTLLGDKVGWIDTTGALVIPATFGSALSPMDEVIAQDDRGAFHDGRAAIASGTRFVRKLDGPSPDYAEGFIDRKGNVVIAPQYRRTRDFHEGFAAVQARGDSTAPWGFIDTTGKVVLPLQFTWLGDFHHGVARVRLNDGREVIVGHDMTTKSAGGPFLGDMGDNGFIAAKGPKGAVYVREDNSLAIHPDRLRQWGFAGYPFSEGRAPVELKSTVKAKGAPVAWAWFKIEQEGSLNAAARQFFVSYATVYAPEDERESNIGDAVTNVPRHTLAVTIAEGAYRMPPGQTEPDLGDIMSHSAAKVRYTKDANGVVHFIDSMNPRFLGRFKSQ